MAGLLGACGQIGPLYLPGETPVKPPAGRSAGTTAHIPPLPGQTQTIDILTNPR